MSFPRSLLPPFCIGVALLLPFSGEGGSLPSCTSLKVIERNMWTFDANKKAIPIRRIPLKPEFQFAWSILIRTDCKAIEYTEIFEQLDRKKQKKRVEIPHSKNVELISIRGEKLLMLSGHWEVSAKDAPGPASIKVRTPTEQLAVFEFEFVEVSDAVRSQ